MVAGYYERRRREQWPREQLSQYQLERVNQLLSVILPHNAFYARKFAGLQLPLTWDQFRQLPFTTKDELHTESPAGFAANLTYPLRRYVRFHRTSGTQGHPLAVLDTAEDWTWWVECWQYVLDAARLRSKDRVVLAFSFGPFIGFWSAYEACAARGALVVPTGGMTTRARLELIAQLRATCLLCTPSYALHMAEVAGQMGLNLPQLGVKRIIVAGEPGGSIPSIRQRIEAAWGSQVLDHSGATEVGPWGYADKKREGLHVNESEFIAEYRPLDSSVCVDIADGQLAELVLTSLGRQGCPVIRYRTGDLVRPVHHHDRANRFVLLAGGVLGRVDDMVIVRGVNVFPTALETMLREVCEVNEFRIIVDRRGELDEIRIEVEDRLHQPERIAELIQRRLGLRVQVTDVPAGTLPRFEGKGRRFIDLRTRPTDHSPLRT